ncbi:hypothetical protein L1987_23191 [Smallanthus sonchifolius]|uniref:Uncharacterized protein n=1 Tax=Smallanthus sonchifolius TaxID=185202 RepID=A0ACB9IIF0_9ASTR|nr:hypothetical protein L1987_23191 [Smallanthus sonchifolius]
MIEDYVEEIKPNMSPDELEKDKLVFYLKANNYKNKQLKNMKIEKLRNLVDQMKKEKATRSEKNLSEEEEMNKLLKYVKVPDLQPVVSTIHHLRHIVNKHKQYKENVQKVSSVVIKKPSQTFLEEDEKERHDLTKEFVALGYEREIIDNCSKDMLLDMKNKLNATREENEKATKLREEEVGKRDEELRNARKQTKYQIKYVRSMELMDEKLKRLKEIDNEIERSKKRRIDVSSCGYRAQGVVLTEKFKELDAAK